MQYSARQLSAEALPAREKWQNGLQCAKREVNQCCIEWNALGDLEGVARGNLVPHIEALEKCYDLALFPHELWVAACVSQTSWQQEQGQMTIHAVFVLDTESGWYFEGQSVN